jgi:transcriptional regulator with XRE-family HTH domain
MDDLLTMLIEFGQWVRQWREEWGYSQEALAVLVGVTKGYISNIERAERSSYTGLPSRPDIDIVDKLAVALKRPIIEARNLAGYGLPVDQVKTVEDALKVTQLLDRKGLSDADREAIRPLLESADRMIELLKEKGESSRVVRPESREDVDDLMNGLTGGNQPVNELSIDRASRPKKAKKIKSK